MSNRVLNPGQSEKIKLNFYFHTLCGASKGFMKVLKAFIKPFEAPQRSVKIKIELNFYLNPAIARFEQNLSSISLFYADYIYISTLYIGI